MSTLADYLALAKANPAFFQNPSHEGIRILLDENEIREIEAQMEAKGLPFEQARVGIIYQDPYLRVIRDAVLFPDGKKGIYLRLIEPVDHAPGVIVLPVYQGQILLLRHFRHATRSWHLEIPRGFGTKGFSDEENIRRELQEEIGGTASRLISLGQLYPNTGMTSECDQLFFAEVESYTDPEIGEAITDILPTPLPEFERMIRDNEITDGFTLAAYTRAKLQGLL